MWKKVYPPLILILLLSVCSLLAQEKKVKKVFRIGVAQFTSTLASEKDQKGFEKALADAGFKEKVDVIFDRQNAQGNLATTQAIAQKFLSEKFDLIHTIGSPSSRATVKLIEDIPVVFSSVTNPMEAGLVPKKSLPGTKTGTNVTGVSHRWPVSLQFEMYTQFLPKAKKWGTIYHQGDPHSLGLIKEMRESAKRLGIELMEAVISSGEEATQAASFLAGKVQAFHVIYDDTVLSSLEAIVKICNEKKVPLFTSDLESVSKGALAAYGLNFFTIGYSAGKRAARILKGENPGHIPWGRIEKLNLVVNEKAARAQGMILSPELLKRSDKIIAQ
ncbi:MAG TPA: ABC transporter substrate-binding protein [Thermodesulfobacteriota bacterium]|nr:ABC transporter substrate-binding protein [Thermodesulfobacteriota bacterium]